MNNYLHNLEVIQKWILKIMFKKDRNYASDDLYRVSNLLDIRQLYALTTLSYLRRNQNMLNFKTSAYGLRNTQEILRIPSMKKTIGQRSFLYVGPKLFNEVPLILKDINSVKLFKKKIKTWLLDKPRNFVHKLVDLKNEYTYI